jgi:hypothetical protein
MMHKAAKKQISVGFLDPDLFTSTNISQHSHQVGKAISYAMMNSYYVVGAYCTSHLLTVKIRQPSHEFTFGVGMSFIPYPLVLTPVV